MAGLKAEERNSPVKEWIFQQRQEDLDMLGLGLRGGIPNGYMILDFNSRGGLGHPWGQSWCTWSWQCLSYPFSMQRPSLEEPSSLHLDFCWH